MISGRTLGGSVIVTVSEKIVAVSVGMPRPLLGLLLAGVFLVALSVMLTVEQRLKVGRAHSQRQTCKVCLRPDKFDFHVPDEVWDAAVPPEFKNRVVCLNCFDDFAAARGVDYANRLAASLWFAGDAATFEFRVSRALPRE